MAHSTATRKAQQFDWYTFLRSALLNGLQAYGASLMVIHRADPIEAQTTTAKISAIRKHSVAQPLPAPVLLNAPALPRTPLTTPAWRQA